VGRAVRQTNELDRHVPAFRVRDHLAEKDEQTAVPLQTPIALDSHPPVRRFPRLREDVRRDGWSRTERPASGQAQSKRVTVDVVDGDKGAARPAAYLVVHV